MKKFKLLGLLVGALALGGCMATISPDGTVRASYMFPEVDAVVVAHSTRPVRVAHNPPPRHHSRHFVYGPRGKYHPW